MPRTLASKNGPRPTLVAARIRAERERLGLSQAEAARRLDVRRTTYKNLESVANPQLSTLLSLVELGMDLRAIAPELFPAG